MNRSSREGGKYENPQTRSRQQLEPPPYDGQTSCGTYNIQFKAAGKVNNLNDLEKATALVIALHEPTLGLFRTLYLQISAVLELHFGEWNLQLFCAQLKIRKQKVCQYAHNRLSFWKKWLRVISLMA